VIKGLAIIGESINDSVPAARALFDAGDLGGIAAIAAAQDAKGAAYIDVNVGRRPPEFMAEVVRRVQGATAKPLSIDTPDPEIAKAGLEAYDAARAGGKPPILNSISPLRMGILELYRVKPFMPILMASERAESGAAVPNKTAEETFETARFMLNAVRDRKFIIPAASCIIDPGIAPIGADTEGNLRRLFDALKLMRKTREFAGVHVSVGLSNFTVMLPQKCADGTPVKSALESAFLTRVMPLMLDMIIGSVHRKYQILPESHPALLCIDDVLSSPGFDAIIRVKEFYS
jgi:5-methyltetrahydrofolate--homocysteine methyltransferase